MDYVRYFEAIQEAPGGLSATLPYLRRAQRIPRELDSLPVRWELQLMFDSRRTAVMGIRIGV